MNKFIVSFVMPLSSNDKDSVKSRSLLEDLVGRGNWAQLTGELIVVKTNMDIKSFLVSFGDKKPPRDFYVIDANDVVSSYESEYKHNIFNNL